MNRTFKSAVAIVSFTLLVSCTKDAVHPPALITKVDVTGATLKAATISADQQNTVLYYSTDNGVTYSEFPSALSVGQKYKVKLMSNELGKFLSDPNVYKLNWSKSNPEPSDTAKTIADFTFSSNNSISVKLTCLYKAENWTGAWTGEEANITGGTKDLNNITMDLVNTDTFVMDNFFGDGVNATFVLTPSSSATISDHKIVLPSQVTSEGGTASGTGTYDPCRGTFTIKCKYVIGGKTYTWDYNFYR